VQEFAPWEHLFPGPFVNMCMCKMVKLQYRWIYACYVSFFCIFPIEQLSCWHKTFKMYSIRDIYEI